MEPQAVKRWVVYVRKSLSGDLKYEFLEAPNRRDCLNVAKLLCDGEVENVKELEPQLMGFREVEGGAYYNPEPADFLTFGL